MQTNKITKSLNIDSGKEWKLYHITFYESTMTNFLYIFKKGKYIHVHTYLYLTGEKCAISLLI